MRVCLLVCALLGSGAEPGKDAERIARLIRQLGDREFAKREAAGQELDTIGEAAMDALEKATADDDLEIRRRARRILQSVTARARADAAKRALARWQGEWAGAEGQKMSIKGDRWESSTPTFGPVGGTLKGIEVQKNHTVVDLVVEEGPTKGQTCKTILRLEGDSLHYCGTYEAARPTEFKAAGNNVYIAWKRPKLVGPAPLPAALEYDSGYFSTDLLLPESKEAVHRVTLKCQVGNGGTGTLSLDRNALAFDAFGDRQAQANPSPLLVLECTLQLIEGHKDRQLYLLRGPKIASRLCLVAYRSLMPWGDGRLLVHGKDGKVRYVVDLRLPPPPLHPPCHPGCFPAGTLVRVPEGTKAIEQIREGDVVSGIDAEGKAVRVKVTGLFRTRNRLVEVRAEGGQLVTTSTQPITLEAGGFRAAGELKAGERIWRWVDGKRRGAKVLGVSITNREVEVFNLVLGGTRSFVAGGFVVRSKPPAPPADPVLP